MKTPNSGSLIEHIGFLLLFWMAVLIHDALSKKVSGLQQQVYLLQQQPAPRVGPHGLNLKLEL